MRTRYSNAFEIFIMTIGWATVLVVLTKVFTPTEVSLMQPSSTTPQVSLLLRHVGCNVPAKAAVVQALTALPWVGTVKVTSGQDAPASDKEGEEARPEEPCAAHVTAAVQDVQQADFMQLLTTLGRLGIAPKIVEFGGLPHFSLRATVLDLSCDGCELAVFDALTPLKVSVTYYATTNQGQIDPSRINAFKWLEAKGLNKAQNTITAKVRNNSTARVDEMIRALAGAGFRPLSVRIVKEADKA